MIVFLLAVLQDKIELKDQESFYLLHKPAAYAETRSWPLVLQLEPREGRPGDGIERWRDRGFVVVVPERKPGGREREARLAKACLLDVKSRFRIDPERVLLAGRDDGADVAAALAAGEPGLFSACAAFSPSVAPPVEGKAPPFYVVLRPSGEGAEKGKEAARALAGSGVDVLVRTGFDPKAEDEGGALEWFSRKSQSKGDLDAVDRFLEARRFLDASLVSLGLLEQRDLERFVRTRLQKIEAAGLLALGSVEVAMGEGKYLDAWLRCRDGAWQFSWVPVGEKLRARLEVLEKDARIRKARASED
jgi:poly(3-hydroxybutyrate) depolymerase